MNIEQELLDLGFEETPFYKTTYFSKSLKGFNNEYLGELNVWIYANPPQVEIDDSDDNVVILSKQPLEPTMKFIKGFLKVMNNEE